MSNPASWPCGRGVGHGNHATYPRAIRFQMETGRGNWMLALDGLNGWQGLRPVSHSRNQAEYLRAPAFLRAIQGAAAKGGASHALLRYAALHQPGSSFDRVAARQREGHEGQGQAPQWRAQCKRQVDGEAGSSHQGTTGSFLFASKGHCEIVRHPADAGQPHQTRRAMGSRRRCEVEVSE